MNILHIGNTAGVPSIITKGQRELGHNAQVLETWKEYRKYPHDMENYYVVGKTGIKDWFKTPLIALRQLKTILIAKDFDIIHVHSGMMWTGLDAPLIKIFQHKPLIVHYHGSDLREGYGMHYQRFADKKIVATPDLLKYVPDAVFVPNPVEIIPSYFDEKTIPYVIHMPSLREKKGTELILEAMNELKREKLNFRFELVENESHEKAMAELNKAHIVIDKVVGLRDKVFLASMGMVSLEAMSAGKLAMCSMTSSMFKYYPECPVISVVPTVLSLKTDIHYFIENIDICKRVGIEGRKYIEKYHTPKIVAKQIMNIYEEAEKICQLK